MLQNLALYSLKSPKHFEIHCLVLIKGIGCQVFGVITAVKTHNVEFLCDPAVKISTSSYFIWFLF